jgi:hypothetical protein
MRVTEDYIKSVLDGTFTTVDYYGKVITTDTDDKNSTERGGKYYKRQVYWTDAEDDLLWSMKCQGRPFNEIAWVLARTEEATKQRYKLIRINKSVPLQSIQGLAR